MPPSSHTENSIAFALEGAIDDDMWMAFGIPVTTDVVQMAESDVTVVGFVGGVPFAKDYYLTSTNQCDYAAGGTDGVCPDDLLGTTANDNVQLTFAQRDNGVSFVAWERALDTGLFPQCALPTTPPPSKHCLNCLLLCEGVSPHNATGT